MEVTLFDFKKQAPKKKKEPISVSNTPEPMVAVGKKKKTLMPASEASLELIRMDGKWPFDFFPDTIIVEEKRIILKRRTFPFYTTTTTVPLGKLLIFEVSHSVFFSSVYLKAYIGYSVEETFQWLTHKSAQRIKDIVDGLRLQETESIEVLEHDKKTMPYTLEKLGHSF